LARIPNKAHFQFKTIKVESLMHRMPQICIAETIPPSTSKGKKETGNKD